MSDEGRSFYFPSPFVSMIKRLLPTLAGGAMLLGTTIAFAASGYTLFGEASNVDDAIQLVSDSDPGFAGIDFAVASGTTFADLDTLATEYNVTDDDCAAGSPRFQINVDTGSGGVKNIFGYLGPEPNYTNCPQNTWLMTDVLDGTRFLDTSQLPGGTFYDTYAHALATYGSYPVTGIQLVADSGYAFLDGEQTVLVDNTNIDGTTYTFTAPPTDVSQCKNGGYLAFDDPAFRNQGQCVSYVQNRSKNR
jgi:hypothetical protein